MARRLGERWWLPGAAVFVAAAAAVLFVFPYVDAGTRPLFERPRIVVWDSHLRPPFSLAGQKMTLAHELAHHARQHDLMVHAAETSFADPDPPEWAQALFGTHPSLADRVALARAWAARQPER